MFQPRERSLLLIVMSAVPAVVLLIACANVATLLLARAAARQREVAIRLSVGSNRMRLIRQLLTESFVLAVAGGAAGLLIAAWGRRVLLRSPSRCCCSCAPACSCDPSAICKPSTQGSIGSGYT